MGWAEAEVKSKHKNAKFFIEAVERTEMVIPEEVIKRWNSNNNSFDGALFSAIAAYHKLQEELRSDILYRRS